MSLKFDEVLKGLEIINTYGDCKILTRTDTIWAGPYDLEIKISIEDQDKLKELYWHDDGQKGWVIYT